MVKKTELAYIHLYNKERMADLGAIVSTAEKLGIVVEIRLTRDGMGQAHSLVVEGVLLDAEHKDI